MSSSELYVLEITIQGLPPLPNKIIGLNHFAMTKHRRLWKLLVREQLWGKMPKAPLKRAALTLTRRSSAPRIDADGVIGSFKILNDCLVELGVLEDDDLEHIGWPVYHYEKARPNKGSVSMKVEELPMDEEPT